MAIIKIRNAAIDLDAAEIPNLPATKITSGTFDNARISLDAAEIPNLDTAKITTGTLADARVPNLNASKITAGTIATARLGSGTANSSTFLRGDNTFAAAGGVNTPAFSVGIGSGNQSISSATLTLINFDSENYDIGGGYNTSSKRFTVPSGEAGKYHFTAKIGIDSNVTTDATSQQLTIELYHFNSGDVEQKYARGRTSLTQVVNPTVSVSTDFALAVGDYVVAKVHISAAKTLLATGAYTSWSGFKIIE